MTNDPGFNPMRWNCREKGCFNMKRRPKIEMFADCFPGKIAMSDVDGIVEIRGKFLILEWKSGEVDTNAQIYVGDGQRIMYQTLTIGGKFTVYVVAGNAETMEVFASMKFEFGKKLPTEKENLASLKEKFASWARTARNGER